MIPSAEAIATLNRYYSELLGYPIPELAPGQFAASVSNRRESESDQKPPDIRLLIFDDRVLAATRSDLRPALERILAELKVPTELLTLRVKSRIGGLVAPMPRELRLHVFYCGHGHNRGITRPNCRRLTESDIPALMAWLYEVDTEADTAEMLPQLERGISDGIVFGAFAGPRILAVARTIAPRYLAGEIEDIAVRTLPDYRRRGYAAALVSMQARAILELGRIPMYRCNWENEASLGVALKVGFEKYAELISFRTPEENRTQVPE
jgi:predicted GNAT family acetyltransferase